MKKIDFHEVKHNGHETLPQISELSVTKAFNIRKLEFEVVLKVWDQFGHQQKNFSAYK